MGLCSSCVNQEQLLHHADKEDAEVLRTERLKRQKARPFLFDLERTFYKHAGSDEMLNSHELKEMWKKVAMKSSGNLLEEDAKLIDAAADEFMTDMDTDGNGAVSYHEFVVHALGGTATRGSLRMMREKFNQEVKKNPQMLTELVESFKAWDKNGDGFITETELQEHLTELAHRSGVDDEVRLARRLKAELLTVADVDGDGKVDMWEAIAWTLGRRKSPVELMLYDISKGATRWAGPLLLGRSDIEAFHSSLLVFGSEYWYGGKIFRSPPPCSDLFGMPIKTSPVLKLEPSEAMPEIPVVKMGYTFVTHEEFLDFVQTKCSERYTGLEKYDLLTHSCIHFTDECLHFLLGRSIPGHCMQLQKMALTPTVRAIRPYLNKYLGGFSEAPGGGDQLLGDQKILAGPAAIDEDAEIGAGTIVIIDGGASGIDEEGSEIIATVLEDTGDFLKVKYFDISTSKAVLRQGVPQSSVIRRVKSS